MSNPNETAPASGRVRSIDALRGFDMFCIVGGQDLVLLLTALFAKPLHAVLNAQLSHAEWEGFTGEDLIMPLFLFIVGAAMPFSFARWLETGQSKVRPYLRIIRRVLVLWVLGMVAQGNLLAFDLSKLQVFSNTLQAIAVGYLVAAIVLMHLPLLGQALVTLSLLGGYWALMIFVPFDGKQAGILEPDVNLAIYIDRLILGRFRDGTSYAWILPSMNYAATVLLGVFAGQVLRGGHKPLLKIVWLVLLGLGCLAAGWIVAGGPVAMLNSSGWALPPWLQSLCDALWRIRFPMNKHIVSSSMVLWAGGWCYLLMAAFYLVIDVLKFSDWSFPFTVIGMNAITAYMIVHPYYLRLTSNAYVAGLADLAGAHGELVRTAAAFTMLWLILFVMYRRKIFLRV